MLAERQDDGIALQMSVREARLVAMALGYFVVEMHGQAAEHPTQKETLIEANRIADGIDAAIQGRG